jgi:autotransporter-associated beta strand protein
MAAFVVCATALHAGTVSTTFSFQQGDVRKDGAVYVNGPFDGATYAGSVDGRITDNTATSAKSTTSPIPLGNAFQTSAPNGQQHCGLFSYDLTELNNFIAANNTSTSAVTVNSVSFKLICAGGVAGTTAMNLGLYGTDPFTSTDCTWSNYTTGTPWTNPYQSLAAPNDTAAYGWTGGPSALTPGLGGTSPNTTTAASPLATGSPLTWTSSAYFIDTLTNGLARPDKTLYLATRGTFFSNSDNRLNVYTSPNATADNRPELLITLSVSDASDWTGASGTSWATAGNWTSAPATGNRVRFNSLSTANLSTTLNADFSLDGISLINPTGPVSIGGTNILTLGTGGLDLSTATQNLTVTAPMVLGGAQIWNVASGRTLSVSGTVTGSGALTLFGAGKVSLGASNILPNGASAGNLTVIGTLDPNGTSQSVNGLSGAGIIDNAAAGTATLAIGNNDATGTFSGTIQNTGGALAVVKQGTGGLTLSGTNSFSGGTTINGGSLIVSSDANLGNASGGLTFGASGNLNINADIASSNRLITLSPGVLGNFQLAGGVDYTNSGKFTGSGNLRFRRTGSGARTATLASLSNDFTGSLTIDQENTAEQISVTVNSLSDPVGAGNIICGALGSNTFPSFRLGSGATGGLTLDNRRIELAGAMNTGSFFIIANDNLTHPITINSDLLVSGTAGTRRLSLSGVAGTVNEFAGDIADGGSVVSVTKGSNAAVWTLSGNNSHTGGTTISGATAGSQLNLNSPTALGTGTFSISGGDNGKIDNTSGAPLTVSTNNPQAWSNNFAFGGTNDLNLGTGGVTLGGNRTIFAQGSTLTVGGVISGAFSLTKASVGGALVLTGNSTYTGGTVISGGSLSINSIADYGVSSAIGAPVSGAIQLGASNNFCSLDYTGPGATANRTVQLGDATPASTGVGTLRNKGTGALTFTAANFNPTIAGITASRMLWLGGTYTAAPNEIQGIIQDNDALGKVALGKGNDASIWVLSGANTYTGGTVVQGGSLKLGAAGSIASSFSVSISAGATLDTSAQATYTIPAVQPLALGIDAGGSGSSGKITAAGLNISNAVVTYNIAGTPDDPVYVLATYTSLTGAAFASVPTPPVGYTLDYAYQGNKIALVQGAPSNTYASWISGFPGAAGAPGFSQDADSDGVLNGAENFFGTNPSTSSGGLVAGAVSGGVFTFTHPQNATPASDVSATYRWSKDLATFNTSGAADGAGTTVTFVATPNTPTSGTTTVTATVTGTATAKLFVRVNVTQTP